MKEGMVAMKKSNAKQRITALFIAVVVILTSVGFAGGLLVSKVSAADSVNDLEILNAMHFIIRNWHTEYVPGTSYNDGENVQQDSYGNYFVLVEGWIVPDQKTGRFQFYLHDIKNDTIDNVTEKEMLSPYIAEMDQTTGSITILTRTVFSPDALETFVGFSISAGHSAVTYDETNEEGARLTITYDKDVRLVKGHVFYASMGGDVGLGVKPTAGNYLNDPEVEIVYAYRAVQDLILNYGPQYGLGEDRLIYLPKGSFIESMPIYLTYTLGELAFPQESGWPRAGISNTDRTCSFFIWSADLVYLGFKGTLKEFYEDPHASHLIEPVPLYSTSQGLHTGTSVLAQDSDGRTFVLELDAWFVANFVSRLTFILDASDSMAHAYNTPDKIDVESVMESLSSEDKTTLQAKIDAAKEGRWADAFLEGDELARFLNPRKTDNSLLGVSGYSYFVCDGKEYIPLAYWNGINKNENNAAMTEDNDVLGRLNNAGTGGWYYLSHDTYNSYNTQTNGTAKVLNGIPSGTNFSYNEISYLSDADTSIRFYIDGEGYLCCFFCNENDVAHSSVVYELSDKDYVKAEAMQRVVSNFSTKLLEYAQSTVFSGIQFNDKSHTGDSLTLAAFSDDSSMVLNMMSQRRGTPPTITSSDVVSSFGSAAFLYNYALTGGSVLTPALEQALDADRKMTQSDNTFDTFDTFKFMIIITDGMIEDEDKEDALVAAAKLKEEENYNIITVLLKGAGTGEDTEEDPAEADFLKQISGDSKDGDNSADNTYFYAPKDLDALIGDFIKDIYTKLLQAHKLESYKAKYYIDPRFNIVGQDGTEYRLLASGKVEAVNGVDTSEPDLLKDGGIKIKVASSNPSAQDPTLNYDAKKDMYYLEWEDQEILASYPSTNERGSNSFSPVFLWQVRIIFKAKDDFIGGNDILLCGNEENMNYIFCAGDTAPSSGLDKAEKSQDNQYLSKGFPRATVDVLSLDYSGAEETADLAVYMGELVSASNLLGSYENSKITDSYYFDYLKRYAAYCGDDANMSTMEILSEWLNLDEKTIEVSVPYMYLPSVGKDNSTGTCAHKKDVVGILTYRFVNDFIKQNSRQENYKLVVEYTPLQQTSIYSDLNITDDEGKSVIAEYYIARDDSGAKKVSFSDSNFVMSRSGRLGTLISDGLNSDGTISKGHYHNPTNFAGEALPNSISDKEYEAKIIHESKGYFDIMKGFSIGHTLKISAASSTLNAVSGGIALELKVKDFDLDKLKNRTFELEATRQFRQTKPNGIDDFGNTFTLVFEFGNLSGLTPDSEGYVTIFAKAEEILGTFGGEEKTLYELPIGTYTFDLDENLAPFISISTERNGAAFKTNYFSDNTLSSDIAGASITDANIANFVAISGASRGTATFYIGTSAANTRSDDFVYDRLGILILSTANTEDTALLTIYVPNGNPNESFLYRITGDKGVNLIVSVKGGGSTTVEVPFGEYTVTEISAWSWKYEKGEAVGQDGKWEIDADKTIAKTTIDASILKAVVAYRHELNNKKWLGGENYNNNLLD